MEDEIDFDRAGLTLKSHGDQLAEISAAHAGSAEENRVSRMLRIYTQGLERLTTTYPDPSNEEAQEWLDELELRAVGIAFGDEYETEPGQFLENWYSSCLRVIAETLPDPRSEQVRLWVDEIGSRLGSLLELGEDVLDDSEVYANAYSMGVLSITEVYTSPDSDAATRWIRLIEESAARTADEQLPNAGSAQFLENFFANAFLKLTNSYGENPTAAEWFSKLQTRADRTTSAAEIQDPSNFLINVYSMALSKLTQPSNSRDPESDRIQAWLATFEDGLRSTAESDQHDSAAGGFLVNVYAQATTRLTGHRKAVRDPETNAWLDQFEQMVQGSVTDSTHQMSAGDFLANYYAFTLEEIVDGHADPDSAGRWLDEMAHRTVSAGLNNQHDHSPAGFAGYVFLLTRLNLAGDSETIEAGREKGRVRLMGAYLANVVSGDIGEYFAIAPKVHRLYTVDSSRAIKHDVLAAVSTVGQAAQVECSREELVHNAGTFVAAGFVQLYDLHAYDEGFTDRVVSHVENSIADQALVDEFLAVIARAIEAHDDGWKVGVEWAESADTA